MPFNYFLYYLSINFLTLAFLLIGLSLLVLRNPSHTFKDIMGLLIHVVYLYFIPAILGCGIILDSISAIFLMALSLQLPQLSTHVVPILDSPNY